MPSNAPASTQLNFFFRCSSIASVIRAILTSGSMRSLRRKPDRSCAPKPGHISCQRHQQAAAVVFRTRDLLVRQRTQAINALRGHLTEFGVIAAKGPVHTSKLIAAIEDPASDLPQAARAILAVLVEELRSLDERVAVLDREIARHAKENSVARRLMTIPGIGAVTA